MPIGEGQPIPGNVPDDKAHPYLTDAGRLRHERTGIYNDALINLVWKTIREEPLASRQVLDIFVSFKERMVTLDKEDRAFELMENGSTIQGISLVEFSAMHDGP